MTGTVPPVTSSQNNSPQTTGPPDSVASHDAPGPGRLPRHVLPRHYALELFPNLDTGTFSGTVAIDVDVNDFNVTEKIEDVSQFAKIKKDIARLMTEQKAREAAAASA